MLKKLAFNCVKGNIEMNSTLLPVFSFHRDFKDFIMHNYKNIINKKIDF